MRAATAGDKPDEGDDADALAISPDTVVSSLKLSGLPVVGTARMLRTLHLW